ncbi:hypothetical protein Vretimale_5440, partial [Volvox reticuliferus]
MSNPRGNGGKTDGSSAASTGRADGKRQREGKDPEESMHHDGNFGRYMQLKVVKLREQFDAQQLQNASAKSDIFRGVAIHVNGFTRPSHAELKQLMALHGGRFENYLHRDSVTHIICSNLPDTKVKQLAHERKPIPIVRPEWVVASINAGRLLPVADFQLEPLFAGHPNQRRLFDFKRHAAPQLPPEELYPVLQCGQQQQQQQEGRLRELPQQEDHLHGVVHDGIEDVEGRPAKRLCRGDEKQQNGGREHYGPVPPGQKQQQQGVPQEMQEMQEHEEGLVQGQQGGRVCPPPSPQLQQKQQQQQQQGSIPPIEQHPPPTDCGSEGDSATARCGPAAPVHHPHHQRNHHEPGGMGTGPGPPPGLPLGNRSPRHPANDAGMWWCPERPRGGSPPPLDRNPDQDPDSGPTRSRCGLAAGNQGRDPDPEGAGARPRSNCSPEAAQALASELRAASDLARGPPRSTRNDPRFVETFFKASRLHFIGTWKTRIEALMAEVEAAAPNPAPYTKGTERVVIHVDMDSFFASAAAVGRPELAGKPVAVCHSNSSRGTGEVSSANYLARSFGVRADMFIAEAKRRCPDLIVVPYEFEKYQTISEQVYRILMSYTSIVQPVSCDEAFLDVTGLGDPEQLATRLRAEVVAATECTASAGIGPNILVAKLATRRAKPNGQFRVTQGNVLNFLGDLKVEDLPGVGWSLASKLDGLGISTVRQVWSTSRTLLQKQLGAKVGADLWAHAHGLDDRRVEPPKARKSVGAEINYGIRFEADAAGLAEAERFLGELAGEVAARLKTAGVRGRSLILKVKRRQAGAPQPAKFMGHGACDNISRSVTLSRFTDDPTDLRREAVGLLRALNIPPEELRGLGITVAKLDNDPASLTTRPSAPAVAKLQAPPRTAFDASKPPPWAAYFQRKAQQNQPQQHQQQDQQQQQQQQQSPSLAAEQSAARSASPPPGYLKTPTKLPSSVAHPGTIPAGTTATLGTGTSLARAAGAAAPRVPEQGPSVPDSSGTSDDSPGGRTPPPPPAPAPAPAPAAAPSADVPSWYASLHNEWLPVSAWDEQRKQRRGRPRSPQPGGPPEAYAALAGVTSQLPCPISGASAGPTTAAGAAGDIRGTAVAGTIAGGGQAVQPGAQLQAVRNSGVSNPAGRGAAHAGTRSRPRLHPIFAALVSQPVDMRPDATSAAAAAASAAGTEGGGVHREAVGVVSEEREVVGGAVGALEAAAAPPGCKLATDARGAITVSVAAAGGAIGAPRADVGNDETRTLMSSATGAATEFVHQTRWLEEPEHKEQGRRQRYVGQQRGPAARSSQPPPRPAVSGTHGGGGGGGGGMGSLAAGWPQPPAVPAISSASAGISLSAASGGGGAAATTRVIESIDLSVDHAEGIEHADEGECAGRGNGRVVGGGAVIQRPISELLEAGAETSVGGGRGGGASQHKVLAAEALTACPAVSETTTVGCPAVSTSAASGSAAARWPASFLRPTVGSSSAARGGSSTAVRGRGGRGRAAAGSSGRRGNAGGRGNGGGGAAAAAAAGSSSGVRDQGPTEVMAVHIDRSVLAELPPDVRREVEREYGLLTVAPTKRPPAATAQGHVRPAKRARDGAAAAVGLNHAPTMGRRSSDGGAAAGHEHQTNPTDSEPQKDTGGPAGQPRASCGAGPSGPSGAAAVTAAMPTSMADVDLAVLDELPAELRSEITAALRGPGAGLVPTAVPAGRGAHDDGLGPAASAAMTAAMLPPLAQRPVAGRVAREVLGSKTGGEIEPAHLRLAGAVTGDGAPVEGCSLAATGLAPPAMPTFREMMTSDTMDVEEVMSVAALPVEAGQQQRLAAAAGHMFRVTRSNAAAAATAGGATSAVNLLGDRPSSEDVRLAFLAAIRSSCGQAVVNCPEGSADATVTRAADSGGADKGNGKDHLDAADTNGVEGVKVGRRGGAQRRLQVMFMALALWLISQDDDLETVVAMLRQMLRLVRLPQAGNTGIRPQIVVYLQTVVRAVQDHVLSKYG